MKSFQGILLDRDVYRINAVVSPNGTLVYGA